eukprot:330102-Chlamydomonas_euryale.AAC.2
MRGASMCLSTAAADGKLHLNMSCTEATVRLSHAAMDATTVTSSKAERCMGGYVQEITWAG